MLARLFNGLVVASALLLPAVAHAQASPGRAMADHFFAGLPVCDALEFSADGYLSEIGPYYPVLTPEVVPMILDYTQETMPRPGTTFPARAIIRGEHLQSKWPRNPLFRQRLTDLADAMRATGIVTVPTQDVVDAAQARLDAATGPGGVECYKISRMTGTSDNEWVSIVELPHGAQAEIDALFARSDDDGFTARERRFLRSGIIDLGEAREMRALRLASVVFEQNTVLRTDLGSYGGNADFLSAIRTTCRNEMQTYYFFLRRLQERGLLRHFAFEETWSHRRNAIPIDGHDGTIFRSLRSGQLFVMDSWIYDGGEPANIVLLSDWLAREDDPEGRVS